MMAFGQGDRGLLEKLNLESLQEDRGHHTWTCQLGKGLSSSDENRLCASPVPRASWISTFKFQEDPFMGEETEAPKVK